MNSLVVRALYHFGKLDAIEGKPDVLVRNGRLLRHHLERELITVSELESAGAAPGDPEEPAGDDGEEPPAAGGPTP